jgi:hypothetical protein
MKKKNPIREGPQLNLRLPPNGRGALARLVRKTKWTKTEVVTIALIQAEKEFSASEHRTKQLNSTKNPHEKYPLP